MDANARRGQADLIIRQARIMDGTGAEAYRADVAVQDDRIVAVGELRDMPASQTLQAERYALAPGFIDVHTHDDRALLSDPLLACKVSQGVTTVVTGNCGVSLAPLRLGERPPPPLDLLSDEPARFFARFSDYLEALDREPPAVNAICQVGHSSLRVGAMTRLDRAATTEELNRMASALETALEQGAAGLSTGLFYRPAQAAPTEEVIALARLVSRRSGIHTTHMRDETDGIVGSLEESFRIGREGGVPVVISHHKCAGAANHGRSRETLALIEAARKGQPLALDVYPYIAGSTVLDAERSMGASRVLITWSVPHPEMAGRDLSEIADAWGCDQQEASRRLQPAGAIYFMMAEEDVRRILAYPHSMIGSDGLPHDSHPHPRLWGTFPRILGHYAREEGLFSMEEAVRRMTGLPSAVFGLADRGVIRPGAHADLVLFDPQSVLDEATFDAPKRPARGIVSVWVNGRLTWSEGASTGARAGRALRRHSLTPAEGRVF